MKFNPNFILLLVALGFNARAQHLSVDFPLKTPSTQGASWEQSIDLQGFPMQDFTAISVVMEAKGLDHRAVRCRMGTSNGWQELPPFTEELVEGRYVSELIFVPAEAAGRLSFQFHIDTEIDRSSFTGRVHVFSPTGDTQADVPWSPGAAAAQNTFCTCPQPDFVARASWGSAFGLNGDIYTPPAVYTTVTHLIVHHSAGSNTSSNWPGVVAAIFDYHVNTNGWSDIGYNWLIAPDGQLFEGRGGGDNVRGSHMCGYNNNTMGVCALGSYGSAPFPAAGLETLKKLLSWKSCREDITPMGNGPINSFSGNMLHISGHRDGCAPGYTECPGNMLYGQLTALRQTVLGYTESACQSVDVEEVESIFSMTLSPNPVLDQLQLQFTGTHPTMQLQIVDALGRRARDIVVEAGAERVLLGMGEMRRGVYFATVITATGNVLHRKFEKL